MTYSNYNASNETITRSMEFMRLCEESDFPEEAKGLNMSGRSFCPSQKEPMVLSGFITTPDANYIMIQLNRCDNYSAELYNVTCKSQDEMNNYIYNKILYIYYTDNTFDLTNFDTPVQSSFIAQGMYFYPNVKKTFLMSVQKTTIYTDLG